MRHGRSLAVVIFSFALLLILLAYGAVEKTYSTFMLIIMGSFYGVVILAIGAYLYSRENKALASLESTAPQMPVMVKIDKTPAMSVNNAISSGAGDEFETAPPGINEIEEYASLFSRFGLTGPESEIIASADPGYIEELKKLADLRKNGILTEEEFRKEKAEILYRAHNVDKLKCSYCGSTADVYLDKCPTCGAPLKADQDK